MNEQMKHRRALMAALGAAAVANPWPALAQPAGRFRRVGILPGGPMAPGL